MEKKTGALASQGVISIPMSGVDTVIAIITLGVLILCAALALFQLAPPQAVPADAPPTEFSSARAMQHLAVIAQRPHPMGSADHQRVRDYIVSTLTSMGLSPQVQQTTAVSRRAGRPFAAGTVENIVARLPGSANSKAIMIAAHYDSVLSGPGANDDGVGVAAMLETARALRAGPPLKNDVILLFSDGEEAGLLGSSAFVAEHPWARDVGVALNLEARGSSGPTLMFETSQGNGWLIDQFARSSPHPIASSLFYDIYRYLPNDTDFTVFKGAGMAGMNFAYIDGFMTYHAAIDDLAHVSERNVQHHGGTILGMTRQLGDMTLGEMRAPDEVFFNIIGDWLVRYPLTLVLPLLALVVALFVAVLVLGIRRGQLSVGGSLMGFLAGLACLILVPAAVLAVLFLVVTLHPQYLLLPNRDTYNSKLYVASFAALATLVVSALSIFLRKKIRLANLAVGALLWWLLLAALTSVVLPGASYLFVWPLLSMLVAWLIVLAPKDQEQPLTRRWLVLLLGAIPGVLLFAPFISMLFVALTIGQAPALSVSIALLLLLLTPHLALMAAPRAWLLPGAAALVAVALLVAGSLTSGFTADRPRPTNVLYGLNADTGQAVWASTDQATTRWSSQYITGTVERGPLDLFPPLSQQNVLRSPAPVLPLAPPQATLLDSSVSGGTRTLRLRISSPRQAPLVMLFTGSDVTIAAATVDGRPIDAPARAGQVAAGGWGLSYWAMPPQGIELSLQITSSGPLRLLVVDRSDGLPAIPDRSYAPMSGPLMPSPALNVAQFSNGTLVSKLFTF